jgi:hypothetical protein
MRRACTTASACWSAIEKPPAYVPGNMGHQERTESQRQKEMKNAEAMWGESGAAFDDAKVHDAKDILWKT